LEGAVEQLELPELVAWEERRLWFEDLEARLGRSGTAVLSEQACALMIDLQAVFCVGAWAATVLLAASIVDSQARLARSAPASMQSDLRWLRGLRNRLMHEDQRRPVITVDDQWVNRKIWEGHARRAVEIAMATLYPAAAPRPARSARS
jgi:hypothetical protein